jgi:hypothetical protein
METKEQISPGITCEWLADHKIMAYTLTSAKLITLSAWSETALQTFTTWPKDRPYLALHDLSYPNISLVYSTAVQNDIFNVGATPGKRKAVTALLDAHPGWNIALAVVIAASYSGSITKLKAAGMGTHDPRIHAKTFFARSYAIEWLLEFAGKNR